MRHARSTLAVVIAAVAALALASSEATATQRWSYRSGHYRYNRPYRPYGYYRPYRPYGYYRPYPFHYYAYGPSLYGYDQGYSYWHGAVQLKVKPVETEVYVDGYYAGVVDDFDGVFQRLYLRPGEHEIELRLSGHRSFRERVLLSPGLTYKVHHHMPPLAPGEREEIRERRKEEANYPAEDEREQPEPRFRREGESRREEGREEEARGEEARPEEKAGPEEKGRQPVSAARFGTLGLRVQPNDAEVTIDGERWGSLEGFQELVIHLPAGKHRIEIRSDGYQPFAGEVEIRQDQMTPLNVKLTR